jgi:peptide chain release factor 3
MLQESEPDIRDRLCREVARRRTFAIISHPDAGKTTLTEKLLLYAGALELAGAVRTRANQRHTVSDWMTMEQQRGISVSATALEMEYQGYRINLLDTPGHQDFCEDTYRTLMAVDSAVMVLDSAKGIEAQTEKLFRVCRMRNVPILTFINKLDHPGRGALALLDEIERKLEIVAVPMNWPVGDGDSFLGVYDFQSKQVLRFQRTVHGQHRAAAELTSLADPELRQTLGERAYQTLIEEIELLAEAGSAFDRARYLAGEMTPVFFGSALNNFGVEPFLQAILDLAPPPRAHENGEGTVHPTSEVFSGFVFKIQANTDPHHRDRMAFLRVCSGHFRKDMIAHHLRLGQNVRMSRAYRLFARERESIDEAFPGDVIGVVSPGLFAIGDMVTTGDLVPLVKIPRFTPEHFGVLSNDDISRYKQFRKGLEQLEEEGVVQVFHAEDNHRREPILAAVGELQFDVVLARLQDEYGVEARLSRSPYASARWIEADDAEPGRLLLPTQGTLRCRDAQGRLVILFASSWELRYSQEKNPDVVFAETG